MKLKTKITEAVVIFLLTEVAFNIRTITLMKGNDLNYKYESSALSFEPWKIKFNVANWFKT